MSLPVLIHLQSRQKTKMGNKYGRSDLAVSTVELNYALNY